MKEKYKDKYGGSSINSFDYDEFMVESIVKKLKKYGLVEGNFISVKGEVILFPFNIEDNEE